MKNIIILFLSAVVLLASENEVLTRDDVTIDTIAVLKTNSFDSDGMYVETNIITTLFDFGATNQWQEPPSEITIEYSSVTNLTWNIGHDTIRLAPSLQVVTNWVAIERLTNAPPSTNAGTVTVRQIGQIQTNQILTLIYQGRTNHLNLGMIGKEEWPSQKRTITESIRRQTMPARR
jgi:hypothetical protein